MNHEQLSQLRLFLDILCARATVFAEMGSVKMTLDDPESRAWSMTHIALTSADTWAIRYSSVEPEMPDTSDDPHYVAELQTLEAMSHFAPLPFTPAWRDRLRNKTEVHLRSEPFFSVVNELFLRLEHIGFRTSRLMYGGRFRYQSAEIMENEGVILLFSDGHETMLIRTSLSEVSQDLSDEQLQSMTPSGIAEPSPGILYDLPLYSPYSSLMDH